MEKYRVGYEQKNKLEHNSWCHAPLPALALTVYAGLNSQNERRREQG